MLKNKNLLLYITLAFTNFCLSQDIASFEHITTNNGLSQSDVNDIYQDVYGFMWFGTHDGLNKYDGYKFSIYKPKKNNNQSISSNLIFSITGDKKGNLWIGTTGSGLNYFDRNSETFKAFSHEKENPESLSSNYISKVHLDSKNRLWVGTINGLNMLDLNKPINDRKFQRFYIHSDNVQRNNSNTINTIYEDNLGQIWVGSILGLSKLSRDENGRIYFQNMSKTLGINKIPVTNITQDHNNRLIIASHNGLYIQNKNKKLLELEKIISGSFTNISVDKNNNLYAGTKNGLIFLNNNDTLDVPMYKNRYVYDPSDPTNSLSKNIIESIYLDKTGIIWIGTNGGGINKFNPNKKNFKHIKSTLATNSLSYDKIRAIYEDSNNTLWVGTLGGGLNMLLDKNNNVAFNNFMHFDNVPNIFTIQEVDMFGKKILMVGVQNMNGAYGIDISNPKNIAKDKIKEIKGIKSSVFSILQDTNKNIWIGTYANGVIRWSPNYNTKKYGATYFYNDANDATSISNDIIRNIFEDKKGDLWFATGNGLNRLKKSEINKKKPKFELFKNNPNDKNSISHNYILSLYENKKGDLWIGTLGGGLNKYLPNKDNSSGKFISFSESDGLPNNVIKGILEDNSENLWVSTNQGLSKFNPENKTFRNYDVNDGLQNNEFQELASLKRKNGEMLFGGINGLNAFFPNDITDNKEEAETIITDFSIFNKQVDIGTSINGDTILNTSINKVKNIELKHNKNSFSFEFAALHYASPLKNKYAYKLEGFDHNWIYTSTKKRFATYTNIEPGNYTFKVKASNNDGIWDSTPASINIKITPPFYKTKWAYAIYCLLFIALLFLLWKYTVISATKKHQLELEHIEKTKFDELQRIKLEFFTNISHEFRTPLTLIKGPLEYLQKKRNTIEETIIQEQYGLMHKNTTYLLRLVNQLLDFRKINQGKMHLVVRNSNIVDFIKEVGEPFQFLARKKSIDFSITTANKNITTWFDHDALEKIMNNLLSNAFKFTPEFGTINIDISTSEADKKENYKILKNYPLTYESVFIKVSDTGKGINENSINTVFERFYIEKDSTNNSKGIGIGLSFTKSLVDLHQGFIIAESKETEGTTFTVGLPSEKTAYENIPEISCKEEFDNDFLVRSSESESFAIGINDEIEDQNLSKSRSKLPVLLVVDDNEGIRTFIKQVLSDTFTVHEAENGEQGLQIATKIIPNIVLSDVVMPIMDGIELCENLKTKKETSHIPVLMLTAKSSKESELKALSVGADDFISKPFSMELLQLKLANLTKSREKLRKLFNRDINLIPKDVTVTSADETFLQQAIEIVEKHMMNTDFNVEMLVKEMGFSRSTLYFKFKEITGLSSSEFIRNIRLKRAMQLLSKSDLSVKEIMYMTGFNTASYFSKCFKKQFGVRPSEYVRNSSNTDDKKQFKI